MLLSNRTLKTLRLKVREGQDLSEFFSADDFTLEELEFINWNSSCDISQYVHAMETSTRVRKLRIFTESGNVTHWFERCQSLSRLQSLKSLDIEFCFRPRYMEGRHLKSILNHEELGRALEKNTSLVDIQIQSGCDGFEEGVSISTQVGLISVCNLYQRRNRLLQAQKDASIPESLLPSIFESFLPDVNPMYLAMRHFGPDLPVFGSKLGRKRDPLPESTGSKRRVNL